MEKVKKRIVIADDEKDLLKVMSVRLAISGYDVTTAVDGEDALEKIRTVKPDLVMLDLMMPKMSGFDVCRTLKFDDDFKNTPIIIVSALHEQHERQQAIECGADAYFIKPFDIDLLLTKIKSLMP